tara:strand:- start:3299 stop:4069 length:771 start_codon:yes stop_codon:yes gene_type:complete
LKVTFDSNVWENIVTADKADKSVYANLLKKITDGTVEPYICMIALTLETVGKKERLEHRANYSLDLQFSDISTNTSKVEMRVAVGPEESSRPTMTEPLSRKFELAYKLGFKVLAMTNFGTPRVRDVPESAIVIPDDYWEYAERLSECSDFIESLECGRYNYNLLVKKLGLRIPVFKLEKFISTKDKKAFSNAVAEWADGDSLAAHYAYNNDYFCTNDQGKSAGTKSVFHRDNIGLLSDKFAIRVVTANELSSLLGN